VNVSRPRFPNHEVPDAAMKDDVVVIAALTQPQKVLTGLRRVVAVQLVGHGPSAQRRTGEWGYTLVYDAPKRRRQGQLDGSRVA
jgi:hypothetical protein